MRTSRPGGNGTRRRRSAPVHVPTLRRQLKAVGIPLATLVDGIPLSVSTIKRGLRGRDIDESSIQLLADRIGISTDELMYGTPTPPCFGSTDWHLPGGDAATHRLIAMGFERDAQQMLRATNLLDLRNVELELHRQSTKAVASRFEAFYTDLARQARRLSKPAELRPRRQILRAEGRTLRVLCQQTLFTTLLLFEYMRRHENVSAQIDLHTRHSALGMLDQIQQDAEADVVALPLVTSVIYYGRTPQPLYRPIALLPRGSHRLVDLDPKRKRKREVVLLPGTATAPAYFEVMRKHEVLLEDDVGWACDPAMTQRPSEIEPTSAVLWFPRNIIYQLNHGGHYMDDGDLEVASKESVLLMRQDLLENQALRDEILLLVGKAHRTLVEKPELVPPLVAAIFQKTDFTDILATEVEHAAHLAG
jgi:hypothetical protein